MNIHVKNVLGIASTIVVKFATAIFTTVAITAIGFILAYVAAWLLPTTMLASPLVVGKAGASVALAARIFKESV